MQQHNPCLLRHRTAARCHASPTRIPAMSSNGGDGLEDRRDFGERLMEWGSTPRVAMIWAIVGCVCSLFIPMFLFLEEGQAVCDPGPIRMMMMLLACVAMAGFYRVGYMLRHHRIMREKPSVLVRGIGPLANILIIVVFGSGVVNGGTWPTVVGFELVVVAYFVLLEMARPVTDFYMLRTFSSLPVMAGFRGDQAWDLFSLGWPTITLVFPLLLEAWRVIVIFHYHKGKF